VHETTFETRRLAFFAKCGVTMTPRRLRDREGRSLYAMENRTDGAPFIVIHGGGDDASEWASLLPHLASDRRWIVVDRPGHGLSYKLDYTGVAYRRAAAQYVGDLLDGLALERASFVGNSMGGYFSLCFALEQPQRVTRLILLGAPAGIDRWVPPFLRLLGLRWVNRAIFAMMANPTPETMREKVFRHLLVANPDRVPDEFLQLEIAASQLPGAVRAWRTLLESVVGLRGFRRRCYIRDDVRRLPTPTTFVWGDRDAFAPPASGGELASQMPHARLVTIAGAGHLPWFDEPGPCARAVNEALEGDAVGSVFGFRDRARADAPRHCG
jgi:pimeloyl-ACP methyl ester carboxylesterase